MKRLLTGCAVLGLVCFSIPGLSQTSPAGPIEHGKRVMASADGGVCRPFGTDGWRCRQFVVQRQQLPGGEADETVARVDYWGNNAQGWYSRHIECPVMRTALKVGPIGAFVDAVLDPAAPGCFTTGERVTNDPYTVEPWPFTSPILLQATLLDPGQETDWSNHVTQTNRMEGGSIVRELCRGHSGWNLRAGELSIGAIGEAAVTGQFSADDTEGAFYSDRCERIERAPAE